MGKSQNSGYHGPKMVKNAEMGWLSRPLFEVGGYFYLKIVVFITCMLVRLKNYPIVVNFKAIR